MCYKWTSVIVILLVVSLVLVASCAKPAPAATPSLTPTPTSAQTSSPTPTANQTLSPTQTPRPTPTPTPKPPRELVVAVENLWNGSLDPIYGAIGGIMIASGALFDNLVDATTDLKPAPGIAERWEESSDRLSWTFYVRKGVKFHDGSDLTAADVKFSIDRLMSPEAATTQKFRLAVIKEVELKDPYAVVVHLSRPEPELPIFFSVMAGNEGVVMPKKYIEEKGAQYFGEHPVGSGPWKLVKRVPGYSIEYEAVKGHWRAKPQFDRLKMLQIPAGTTRSAMLMNGEADFISTDFARIAELEKAGFRILSVPKSGQAGYLVSGTYTDPKLPTYDVRVRKALDIAINREEIIKVLMAGRATICRDPGTAPTAYWYDPQIFEPSPYNPEQAKQLLREAGYASGFKIKLFTFDQAGQPYIPKMAEVIAGYWQRIGVSAEIVTMDQVAFRSLYLPTLQPQLAGQAWTTGGPIAVVPRFPNVFPSKSILRMLNIPELDDVIAKAVAAPDIATRTALWKEAAKIQNANYVVNGIAFVDVVYAASPKIAGWTPLEGLDHLSHVVETIRFAE